MTYNKKKTSRLSLADWLAVFQSQFCARDLREWQITREPRCRYRREPFTYTTKVDVHAKVPLLSPREPYFLGQGTPVTSKCVQPAVHIPVVRYIKDVVPHLVLVFRMPAGMPPETFLCSGVALPPTRPVPWRLSLLVRHRS